MGLILHARTFGMWIFILAATTVLSFYPLFHCFSLPVLCLCLCVHASANVPILFSYFTTVQPKYQHEKVLKSEKPVWQNRLWEPALHFGQHVGGDEALEINSGLLPVRVHLFWALNIHQSVSFRLHLSYQKKFKQRQFNTPPQIESNDHYLIANSAAQVY